MVRTKSVAGYRNPRIARKTRADEPIDLDVSDSSALIHENYLLATASAQPKADTVQGIAYCFNPSELDLYLTHYTVAHVPIPTK
jgi:hypothetical protein